MGETRLFTVVLTFSSLRRARFWKYCRSYRLTIRKEKKKTKMPQAVPSKAGSEGQARTEKGNL